MSEAEETARASVRRKGDLADRIEGEWPSIAEGAAPAGDVTRQRSDAEARTDLAFAWRLEDVATDDPIAAMRIKEAGATSVMPAGSPIGSGQGVLNRANIALCLELLKQGDHTFPVIVDAGVGSASDVSIAMELGADGVLLNTAIAHAKDPVMMAHAMRHACTAGRQSHLAGRIPRKLYASASSPWEGAIGYIPGE